MVPFTFRGQRAFLDAVRPQLLEAGYQEVQESASASVALTYCSSHADLEEVYFGDDGLITMLEPGSILIDLSTTTPAFARDLNSVGIVNDMVMVEAPIGVKNPVRIDAFAKENLTCLVSGEEDSISKALPLLEAIADQVTVIGPSGAANLMQCAAVVELAAFVLSSVEADSLMHAHQSLIKGVDPSVLASTLISPERAAVFTAIHEGLYDGAYTVEMMMGALSAALMAADDAEAILPEAEAALHLMELLSVIGGMDKNPAALALVYREEAVGAAEGLDWTRAEFAYGSTTDDAIAGMDDDFDDFSFLDDDPDED